MSTMRAPERRKLLKALAAFIIERGGREVEPAKSFGKGRDALHIGPRYIVATRAGDLHVHPDPDTGTIFCRFDAPERAVALGLRAHMKRGQPDDIASRLNAYSGKWNFHWSYPDMTAEAALAAFAAEFKPLALERT